jgi:hypothetical protein
VSPALSSHPPVKMLDKDFFFFLINLHTPLAGLPFTQSFMQVILTDRSHRQTGQFAMLFSFFRAFLSLPVLLILKMIFGGS